MSEKRSLSFQREAVEIFIARGSFGMSEDIIEAAKQACLTIGYFERRQELLRMLIKLERDHPELAASMRAIADAFPGVEISDVRDLDHANTALTDRSPNRRCRGDRTGDSPHDDGA